MEKITEVILGEEYQLTIRFDNHQSVSIDMKNKLHTARFSEIRNKQRFDMVKTDGKLVYWPDGISLSISEIMENVAK